MTQKKHNAKYLQKKNTLNLSCLLKFMIKSKPFREFLFDSTIVNEIEPTDWWKSQTTKNYDEHVLRMNQQSFSS